MWNQIIESVFYQKKKKNLLTLKNKSLQFLEKKKNLNSKKSRVCVHDNSKTKVQEMFVFHKKGAYVRPHMHLKREESFHIVKGSVKLIIFDKKGKIIKKIDMGEYSSGKTFYYKIKKNTFHTQIILKNTLFKEVTSGPFNDKENLAAKWSPKDSDKKDVKNFLKNLQN